MIREELNRRFSEYQQIAVTIAKLIPSYIPYVEFSDVPTMFDCYKDDLQTDNMTIYKAEFNTWNFMILKIQDVERPDTIEKTLKLRYSIKFLYPDSYVLLQLHALIPISIAGADRSFSTSKLIKTYLQNQISHERLSDLVVINIH